MTNPKTRDELAHEYFKKVPWEFFNNMSFESCYANGFKMGWNARDPEIEKLRAQLKIAREALLSIDPALRNLADVFKNGSGNLSKEQKVWAHDDCLVISGYLSSFVVEKALSQITALDSDEGEQK